MWVYVRRRKHNFCGKKKLNKKQEKSTEVSVQEFQAKLENSLQENSLVIYQVITNIASKHT